MNASKISSKSKQIIEQLVKSKVNITKLVSEYWGRLVRYDESEKIKSPKAIVRSADLDHDEVLDLVQDLSELNTIHTAGEMIEFLDHFPKDMKLFAGDLEPGTVSFEVGFEPHQNPFVKHAYAYLLLKKIHLGELDD